MNRSKHGRPAKQAKSKLADEIAGRMGKLGFSQKELAQELGLNYDTLRKDLSSNKFFESDLGALCKKVGLPSDIDKLAKDFDFALKTVVRGLRRLQKKHSGKDRSLADVFLELDARMERVRRYVKTVEGIIPDFFGSLKAGDVLGIYISDEMPVHWGPGRTDLLRTVAAALKSGARIVYLHPSSELVKQCSENGYAGLFTPEQVQQEFDSFKNLLAVCDSDPAVLQNLCLVQHDCPFVCVPEHRYVLYFFGVSGISQIRSTGTFPIRHKQQRERAAEYQVMELSDSFTAILQKAWIEAVQRQIEKEKAEGGASPTEPFLKAALFPNRQMDKTD